MLDKKWNLRLKKGDLVLLIVIAAIALASTAFFWQKGHEPTPSAYVRVENLETGEDKKYPLYEGQDEILYYEGPIGQTAIHFLDGAAAITSSDCPDQVCVHVFGWISKPNQLSVCLPNMVLVQIEPVSEDML